MNIHQPPNPEEIEISILSPGVDHEQLLYGVHMLELSGQPDPIAIASAGDFLGLLAQLATLSTLDRELIILTPELITEVDAHNVVHNEEIIADRISQIRNLSRINSQLKILLGTPYWQDGQCYNSVLVIQGGEILQLIHKTYLTPGEDVDFYPSTLDKQPLSDTTLQLLICSDLNAAGMTIETLVATQQTKGNTFNHYPSLVEPTTKVILVSACWGSGSNTTRELISKYQLVQNGTRTIEAFAQASFQLFLRMAITKVFDQHPNVETIIICDRVPVERGTKPEDTITSSHPLSGVFHRPDRNSQAVLKQRK